MSDASVWLAPRFWQTVRTKGQQPGGRVLERCCTLAMAVIGKMLAKWWFFIRTTNLGLASLADLQRCTHFCSMLKDRHSSKGISEQWSHVIYCLFLGPKQPHGWWSTLHPFTKHDLLLKRWQHSSTVKFRKYSVVICERRFAAEAATSETATWLMTCHGSAARSFFDIFGIWSFHTWRVPQ